MGCLTLLTGASNSKGGHKVITLFHAGSEKKISGGGLL